MFELTAKRKKKKNGYNMNQQSTIHIHVTLFEQIVAR